MSLYIMSYQCNRTQIYLEQEDIEVYCGDTWKSCALKENRNKSKILQQCIVLLGVVDWCVAMEDMISAVQYIKL